MRGAAQAALVAGQSQAALQLTNALLIRDKNDVAALFLRSKALRNLGDYPGALAAARKAWRLAEKDDARFGSALAIAQAHSSAGNRTLAQIWLRRAVDIAPSEEARAIAVRDFRYVRARNPWAAELSFNVTPSNNINNGSAREKTQLFGLPFEFQLDGAARALSGYEVSGAVAGRYRIDQNASFAHDITFQFSHRSYILTEEAKAQAPGVKGRDFAFSQAAIGYSYYRTPENWPGPFSISVTGGNTWYAGDPYFAFLRVGGTQNFRLGETALLQVSGSLERQFGAQTPDVDRMIASARLMQQVGQLGTLGFTLANTTSVSESDANEFTELRGGVDFQFAKPLLGIDVSFGVEVRERDYIRSRYDPAGRKDSEVLAHLDLVFREIDRFGFNPTLRVQSSRTDSTIGLFDREKLGVQVGIRSAF